MLTAALRDLQFRRRRFAIATLGAALVFGLSVTLSGLAASFDREAERTIDLFGAEGWVIDTNAAGLVGLIIGYKPFKHFHAAAIWLELANPSGGCGPCKLLPAICTIETRY